MRKKRDHGGGLDAAVAQYGGTRSDWLDLSTGINPVPYPVGEIDPEAWTALPDQDAMDRLLAAARAFWNVPVGADIVAANGASAIIAKVPHMYSGVGGVYIPQPTYNEHAAAIEAASGGIWVNDTEEDSFMDVLVHPNNPDGRLWGEEDICRTATTVIDESFCDVTPEHSHIEWANDPRVLILKSFGKFWGLAGLRLGFAIGAKDRHFIAQDPSPFSKVQKTSPLTRLRDGLGPWSVAGPALAIGARALEDVAWAEETRKRLTKDAARLDRLVGCTLVGGTDLFRTYEVADAAQVQDHLAKGHVWSRVFPYFKTWNRLGLPHPDRWGQLEAALDGLR